MQVGSGEMGRGRDTGNLTCTHPTVVAYTINVDGVCSSWCVYFERDCAALVDADVGGKTLDCQISGAPSTYIHSLDGFPVRQFSATIGFAGLLH